MKYNRILVIGGTGFVGSYFVEKSRFKKRSGKRRLLQYSVPNHKQLDISEKHSLSEFFSEKRPTVVINFAAITNMDESEKERNNKKSKTWKTNYLGVANLVGLCKKYNSFLVQISTDAVFPGTDDYPGPYRESDRAQTSGMNLNWYGFTKLKAEEKVMSLKKNFAIVRISHPFGNPKSERDLVHKTIEDIKKGHKLFVDQLFTPTFLGDLTRAIWQIQSKKITGIFHVGCHGLVPRIEFDRYLAKKLRMKQTLKVGSLKEFISAPHRAPRTRLGGFNTEATEKRLGISFHFWQDALDHTIRTL